tara:strand:- start:6776 stop:7108 length:333 start_codon:yes stop_codon:yes gene_type:complete
MQKIKKAILKIEQKENKLFVTISLLPRKTREQKRITITQEEVKVFLIKEGYKVLESMQKQEQYHNFTEKSVDKVVWAFSLESNKKPVIKKKSVAKKKVVPIKKTIKPQED